MELLLSGLFLIGVLVAANLIVHWILRKFNKPIITHTVIREIHTAEKEDPDDWWKRGETNV